ncbi:hypothetical protein LCGC14_2663960 [marine sediment metagenome]|uniref:Uncharacterized protein n=1 Tax=marine sediment metagenome TaxID=412755 RepID=A0A0F9CI03_9ZZZZ
MKARFRVEIFWAWYDAWIGAYWNKDKRILYICPLIFVVTAIHFPKKLTTKTD